MENFGPQRNLYDPYAADSKVLSGMFCDCESTEKAYLKLIFKGYSLNEISFLMSESTRRDHFTYLKDESEFGSQIAEIAGDEYASGGTFGSLISLGIPESRVKLYYSGIKEGNVVIIVTPKDEADAIYLLNNWRRNRGEEVYY